MGVVDVEQEEVKDKKKISCRGKSRLVKKICQNIAE